MKRMETIAYVQNVYFYIIFLSYVSQLYTFHVCVTIVNSLFHIVFDISTRSVARKNLQPLCMKYLLFTRAIVRDLPPRGLSGKIRSAHLPFFVRFAKQWTTLFNTERNYGIKMFQRGRMRSDSENCAPFYWALDALLSKSPSLRHTRIILSRFSLLAP